MANMTITNVDVGNIILHDCEFRDYAIAFGGADVLAAGTILALDSSTQKLVIFVKGGNTNGNGVPRAVLTYDVEAVGAGDVYVRACISGVVKKQRLIIDAQGDGSAVDNNVISALADQGIVAIDCQQLGGLDTQD